jgi:uncharacterized protein (DUF58 family)
MLGQSDAVALYAGGSRGAFLPPRASSSHLTVICQALGALKPEGTWKLSTDLEEVSEKIQRRSIVIGIGDLLEDTEPLGASLRRIRGRGHEVILFHVVDSDEIDFPFPNPATFVDMEGSLSVLADPQSIRSEYQRVMDEHLSDLVGVCTGAGIDYARFATDTPLDVALARFLGWRQFRSSGR